MAAPTLSSLLKENVIQSLREWLKREKSPITFEQAMQFLLTDGVLPAANLPAKQFLKLEDWIRSAGEKQSLQYTTTELKNKTGEILEHVLRGKTIRLYKHKRPVAEIKPV